MGGRAMSAGVPPVGGGREDAEHSQKKNLQNVGQHFCCKMLATLFSIEILIQLSKKMLVNIFVFKMLKIFVIMEALGKKRRKV
jgi:hypothetical protein